MSAGNGLIQLAHFLPRTAANRTSLQRNKEIEENKLQGPDIRLLVFYQATVRVDRELDEQSVRREDKHRLRLRSKDGDHRLAVVWI